MPNCPTLPRTAAKLLLLASLSGIVACGSDTESTQAIPKSGNEPVATVNGRAIPRGMYDVMLGVLRQEKAQDEAALGQQIAAELTEADRQSILDRLITLEAVLQEAEKQGFGHDDAFLHELELQRKTLIAQRFLAETTRKIVIDDAAIEERYAQLPKHFEYNLQQIVTADEAGARAAIAKLESGADFAQLAKDTSQGPEAVNGGNLGWLMAEQLHASLATAVRSMQPGTYSHQPLQTPQGWHVVRVEDVRELGQPPLESAREWIEGELRNEKIQQMIDQMRSSANVETLTD